MQREVKYSTIFKGPVGYMSLPT